MTEGRFRRAHQDESDLLAAMTLAGVRYWGHHKTHRGAYQGLATTLATDDGFDEATVFVLEEDGDVVAFYDLRDRGDHVELLRLYQRTDLIGTGYGRRLWEHCVVEAARLGDRMVIRSDPRARGFYEAMGAKLEKVEEVAPGFELGVYWYKLD